MDKFPRKRSAFRVWIEGRNKELQDFYGKRKINYPELGEQLDCIWHDIDDGILPGKEGRFYRTFLLYLAICHHQYHATEHLIDLPILGS